MREWLSVANGCKPSIPARALYSGIGWNYVLRAEQLIGGTCDLWVVSAGFGLIRSDEFLPSYAATFAAEQNRVADQLLGFRFSSSAHTAWWNAINMERERTQTPLRSALGHYDRVIIALSAPYLAAVRSDLELLATMLGPEKLWLIAVGVDANTLPERLSKCAVPLTIEVERLVSSPRATLNLRALVWWLEEIVSSVGYNREAQKREISCRLVEVTPKSVRVARTMSDEEVALWLIEQQTEVHGQWPPGGKTQLLKSFRASGLACEQKRFSRICEEVMTRQSA